MAKSDFCIYRFFIYIYTIHTDLLENIILVVVVGWASVFWELTFSLSQTKYTVTPRFNFFFRLFHFPCLYTYVCVSLYVLYVILYTFCRKNLWFAICHSPSSMNDSMQLTWGMLQEHKSSESHSYKPMYVCILMYICMHSYSLVAQCTEWVQKLYVPCTWLKMYWWSTHSHICRLCF